VTSQKGRITKNGCMKV